MRIIDYYNIGALILLTLIALYALHGSWQEVPDRQHAAPIAIHTQALMSILIAIGMFLRTLLLERLPYGLQQDEASIGYEAYCLAHYGIDRHGYAWPVYPITWGSGGGSPLMIYLNVITSRVFGSSVMSVRMITSLLGVLTLSLFYAVLQKTHGRRTALAGLGLLTFCPWHIILSRWSLDSNTMPFFQIWMILLLLNGALAERRRLGWYMAGCVLAGICLYDYGSATVVIPLFLVLYVAVLFHRRRITIREAILSALAFLVTSLPITYFYGVQYLGFPEVNLSWISFNRFTASHASAFVSFDSSLPRALSTNLVDIVRVLTIGITNEDRWNAMPEYAALYKYMLPFLVIGLAAAVRGVLKRPADQVNFTSQENTCNAAAERATMDIFLCMFASAAIFGLFINVDINRMVLIFLPAIYLETLGLRWLVRSLRRCHAGLVLSLVTAGILIVGFASFAKDYYSGYYNEYAASVFMPGYGECMRLANDLAEQTDNNRADSDTPQTQVYSTYTDVASPFMITLFYTQYNPYEFMDTAQWKALSSEFQVATSFGRFTFGLPEELDNEAYADDIFVVTNAEAAQFSRENHRFDTYGNFTVVAPEK